MSNSSYIQKKRQTLSYRPSPAVKELTAEPVGLLPWERHSCRDCDETGNGTGWEPVLGTEAPTSGAGGTPQAGPENGSLRESVDKQVFSKETQVARTTVVWRQGMHFCTTTQSGQLMCDESSEMGAVYPSSPELLMASLGSCIGSVLVYFAERRGIRLEGMSIDLDWKIKENPHRIGQIDIAVSIPQELSKEQQKVLTRVAEECLIHNTLRIPPQMNMTLSGKKEAAARTS